MNEKLDFTFFTPIFNRKHTIHRVWESLNSQSRKNFEWIIVNDGSDDGVESLLEKYKKEAEFPIRIFHQKNSGKHIAFNKAIDEAQGFLFVPADSDDSFVPNTIEIFEENWKLYGGTSISGIDVLCKDIEDQIIGDLFPVEGVSTFINIFFRHRVKGEKWGCIRLDILREFKFPEIMGAHFFPESFIWSQIGLRYQTIFLNTPLRIYHQDAGNQLMKVKSDSIGTYEIANYYSIWWVNNIYPKVEKFLTIKEKSKRFYSIWKSTFDLKKGYGFPMKEMNSVRNKFILIITYLPSQLLYRVIKRN